MSDNKKYYYLKLKENFFDTEEIKVLESMPNGYKYSNILLKLYLKSLKFNGALRLNEYIPYNLEMISAITGHDIDTVRTALSVFKGLKLTETLENGTIYMLDIQNFIGKTSTEADRVRLYRTQIESEKNKMLPESNTNDVQMYDKCTPEIEIRDRDKRLEKEIEIEIISWKDIIVAWNDLPSPVKPINSITDRRKNKIKARVNSLKLKCEDILRAISNIKESDFLQGKNSKGWIIDFDWLFKDDTRFNKVFEGQYKNQEQSPNVKQGKGNFNNYEQRTYDFDSLEKKLLGWD